MAGIICTVLAVREYIKNEVDEEIQHAAAMYGHQVLFTPPYQSDLEPIELVCARAKNEIALLYDNSMCWSEFSHQHSHTRDNICGGGTAHIQCPPKH